MTILEAAEILDEHAKAGVAYWNKPLKLALSIASDVLRKVDAIQNIDVEEEEGPEVSGLHHEAVE